MGWVAAIQLGATALGAYSQYKSGKEQSKLFKQNATLAGYQAQDAIAQGEEEVRTIRENAQRTVGDVRAAAAGSGLLANRGSALDVQMSIGYQSEMDALRARYNALRKAWGYNVEASSYLYQGDLAKQQGWLDAIGVGAQGYGNYLQYQDLKNPEG